jgi:bacillithiol biosynthesis cysteine-adding enzyme BshC
MSDPGFDLAVAGLLPPLPTALVAGRAGELLAPLRFLPAGELPGGEPPAVDRRALAAALATTNAAYGHPEAAALAARLADPATRVVVAGQQVGLFGGPLYTLVKAVAATRWAEALTARGEPAVAVFWMATEDHDWQEATRAVLTAGDEVHHFDLGPDQAPLLPVGLRTLGTGVESLLAELGTLLPGERGAAWLAELGRWYHPGARFGEAFAQLLAGLLGPRCPLLLDALLPELKAAEAPWQAALVARRDEVAAALAAADRAVEAAGFPLQVAPQPDASPLFLLRDGARRRIEWRPGGRFALRGAPGEHPVAELEEALAADPMVVGPGVLARPAIQDAVLGTTLQVMGPGEVAYLAQASAVYRVLGIPAPWVTLRPQALLLEARQRQHLADLGLSLAGLLTDPEGAARELGERAGGDFVAPVRETVLAALAALRDPAVALDAQLERPFAKTRDGIAHSLELFAARVAAAAARRDEGRARRFAQLRTACLPDGHPQERLLTGGLLPARYGEALIAALFAQLGLDPRRLSVITP